LINLSNTLSLIFTPSTLFSERLNALHHLSFVDCNHHVDLIFLDTKPSACDNVILSRVNASNNFSGQFSHLKIAID
jgi:hypothetical protein